MRNLVVLVCLVLGLLGTGRTAIAEEANCGNSENASYADCLTGRTTFVSVDNQLRTLPASGNHPSSASSGPTKTYVPYNRLVIGPDGKECATTGYAEEGVQPEHERLLVDPNPRETNIPITGNDLSILETYPPCPQQPIAPGQPAPILTRSMVAAQYWERVPLPKPQPSIAPGRAITGKMAYLETKGEISHTYNNNVTMFGPLRIVATGSYTVAWGDGETTGPHSFEGQSWPSGQITHDYLKVGSYNIVVTEKWTATWSLDGESGTLRTLQTTGRIDGFPVEQIQAVIGR
jgi:hypothetical protein